MQTIKTFSPKELGPIIGVSQSSIKRWVDAGLIQVTRTAGGHRRITLTEALRFIRKREMPIMRPDLLGLPDLTQLSPTARAGELSGEVLLQVLKSGNASQARGLISSAFLSGRSPADLFDGPLAEAFEVLGELWKEDDCGIYLEHQATQICIEAVNNMRMLISPTPSDAPVALGGAPEQDPYILPSMMAATVLANAGYQDVNLGAKTPADALQRAAESYKPTLVWIAATSREAYKLDKYALRDVAQHFIDEGIEVVYGGQAISTQDASIPSGAKRIGSMKAFESYVESRLVLSIETA